MAGLLVNRRVEGVSPIISEVILVAVVIAISLIAASWLLGLWGVEQENFIAIPYLYVTGGSVASGGYPELVLFVRNDGVKSVVILRVEILMGDRGSYVNSTEITVEPGFRGEIRISGWEWVGTGDPPDLVRGGMYRVKVYTDRFGVYIQDVVSR